MKRKTDRESVRYYGRRSKENAKAKSFGWRILYLFQKWF